MESIGDSPTENIPLFSAAENQNEYVYEELENHKNFKSMFWEEFYMIPGYALPAMGSNILEFSLVFLPTIFVGHLSTTALASITLGSMTATVTGLSIIQGLASALDTLLPSAWTSTEQYLMGLWVQRMGVVMTIAIIPIFAIWFNAEAILLLLKQDPDVARMAAQYLRWFSIGLPAFAFNAISRRYFQAQGLFSIPTKIFLVVAPINALTNWILILGPRPIRLGFIGAPIASATSLILISLLSLFCGVYYSSRKAWHPISTRMFSNVGLVARLGLSGVGQIASGWWALELIGLAASLLGPAVLASQSILLSSAAFSYQFPFSLATATTVRIGNLLGERKAKRAEAAAYASVCIGFFLSVFTSLLYFCLRNQWAYIFNKDPEVVNLVASVMPLVSLSQIVDGNSVITGGILTARGQQFVAAVLNFSAYYALGIPVGIWLTFNWRFGLHGLWIGLTVALIYRSVVGMILCIKTNWEYEVVKGLRRVGRIEDVNLGRSQEEHHSIIP